MNKIRCIYVTSNPSSLTCISHGQVSWTFVTKLEVLVLEFLAVDGLTAATIAFSEISA